MDKNKYNDEQLHLNIKGEMFRRLFEKGEFHSFHEAYAIIKEELEELWEAIRKKNITNIRNEALQLSAMVTICYIDVYYERDNQLDKLRT